MNEMPKKGFYKLRYTQTTSSRVYQDEAAYFKVHLQHRMKSPYALAMIYGLQRRFTLIRS